MYTTHTWETEDLFVCGVCDAALVSWRDPDQEGEEDQESGEEEESGAPNIDMSLVDHQFYVCRLCDDVFVDRKHLEVHLNINHDLNEFAEKEHATTLVTPPQSPNPRRLQRKMVDSVRNAREVYRVGLSQAQTPGKAFTTITPPQVGHPMFIPHSDHSVWNGIFDDVDLPEEINGNDASNNSEV